MTILFTKLAKVNDKEAFMLPLTDLLGLDEGKLHVFNPALIMSVCTYKPSDNNQLSINFY